MSELQERCRALELDLGLLKIQAEHNLTLLKSCETALAERDERIKELENKNDNMVKAIAVFAREDLFCTDSNVEATYGKWVFEGKEDIKDLEIVELMIDEANTYD